MTYVINAAVIISVIKYTCHCFLVRPKECKQFNICEHVYPAVTVTSKAAEYSWHHWRGACLCVCSVLAVIHTHIMLTALSAHCSQTACHRPRARHILLLWCHNCETEHTSWGIFCFCFCFFTLSFTNMRLLTDVTQPWPHHRPESLLLYNVFTIILKP